MNDKLKVLSLFSGIGAFEKALTNLNIDYELISFSEINKHAIESYCAIHNVNKTFNLGDITKINIKEISNIDLLTHGSPCQDYSIAGKQEGGDKDSSTRSSLMWNTVNVIRHKKPKYVIWENVKNVLSKKHKHNFDKYISELNDIGYNSYYKVLNAKDYSIPQNRERIFVISIRKDIDDNKFELPHPQYLNKTIFDVLENNVDTSYHVNEHFINKIRNTEYKRDNYIIDTEKILNREFNESLIMDYRYDEGLRIRKNNICPTLTTRGRQSVSGVPIIYHPNKPLRFITPLECWRLMGFTDEDFYKAKVAGISEPQLYKQAGNSIVVNVVQEIFKNLLHTYLKK